MSSSWPKTKRDFEDSVKLEEYLAAQIRSGRLALVLGSDILTPFLPKRSEILRNLYSQRGQEPSSSDAAREAERFRRTYFGDDYASYIDSVHDALYKGVSVTRSRLQEIATLHAIASIVIAIAKTSITEVITFNLDDILETYLEYHGLVTKAVGNDQSWTLNGDAVIVHPYGYLPKNSVVERSPRITLGQKTTGESHESHESNDGRRQHVVSIMRRHVCLFVGVNPREEGLEPLLEQSRRVHAALNSDSPYWGVTISTAAAEADSVFWAERNIYLKTITDYATDLPRLLFSICDRSANRISV